MRRSAEQTRDHVLEVASRLFYWNGIRATGVDRVAAEADVAPTTLYRLFPSKDALVTAYVDQGDLASRAALDAAVASGTGSRERILAAFASLGDVLRPDLCRGCSSQMTLAEYPDPESGPRRRATQAKEWTQERLTGLAADFGAEHAPDRDAVLLAWQMFLVYEGLVASALSGPGDRFVGAGLALVETLLDHGRGGSAASMDAA